LTRAGGRAKGAAAGCRHVFDCAFTHTCRAVLACSVKK